MSSNPPPSEGKPDSAFGQPQPASAAPASDGSSNSNNSGPAVDSGAVASGEAPNSGTVNSEASDSGASSANIGTASTPAPAPAITPFVPSKGILDPGAIKAPKPLPIAAGSAIGAAKPRQPPAAAAARPFLQPPAPKLSAQPAQSQQPPQQQQAAVSQPPTATASAAAANSQPPSTISTLKLHPAGRELKVEDALLYLDQVKLEFGSRPRIYNEFLEIMKCFKAQEVDTVGVINRVRTLFRGYNNLILGFNTFLPEGYKIEMRGGEVRFVGPGLREGQGQVAGQGGNTPLQGPSGPQFMQGKPLPGRGGPGGRGAPQQPGRGLSMLASQGQSGGPTINMMPMPGRGRGAMPMPGRGMGGRGVGMGGRGPQLMPSGAVAQPAAQGGLPQQPQQTLNQMGQQPPQQPNQPSINAQPQQQQQQGPAQRAVEFDHAIMYVTNIKKRFASQPRTYHTFLEILHTYQKEQRGIKEVLEQVSSLFADHPDLLREFTFFLPDAVQEQAKERLSRAAAEAEAKQRAAVEAAAKAEETAKKAPTGWRAPKGPTKRDSAPPPAAGQKFIDMTQPNDGGSPRRVTSSIPQKREAFVYNSGVERQFFDSVKSALFAFSRDGQAYAEFIKTLDMYAQEILSRNDMLGYVERLLGKNRDLFEQFKCIIAAIGAPDAPVHDDSWHSVPLSEIDFSRCRRCTPSYRALPRDYPNPPCSERSEEELKVLNDVWVSLPVGSEESYTFRHMRKNQYEEVLFRCEDMRFEIDMCIDGNAATLQRLTKIYDELQLLSKSEKSGRGGSDGSGLGGKTFQYTLDGRVLSVIHKHTIKRIYGDDGPEMLDLCFRNPAVAIPIVVNRLRQKDEEWRAAKEALNRKWKDLAEFNYYKSLDHRSITWRTTDKRATSTRTLVAEIKDRAANNGYEGEQALNAKKDKAKEEHGTFYEVTMGSTLPKKMDLTGLPKPTKTLFTPHLSNTYSNNSWAQRDAYRIISFALERGSASPTDKERCYRLWRDFLAPWFELELSWMQSPAVNFVPALIHGDMDESEEEKGSSKGDGETDAEGSTIEKDDAKEEEPKPASRVENRNYFDVEGHLPFPPGTSVSTTLGEAKVVKYNEAEGKYELTFAPGTTKFLPVDSVFCSVFPPEPSDLTNQLRTNDQEVLERSDDNLMIGTQCLYLFFRLHQILVRRLNIAKKLATDVSKDTALGRHIEKLTYKGDPEEGTKRYNAFISLVYSLLDAGGASSEATDGGKYEDRVRCLLGNQSYELTTMDKLISHILKNLQHMANDDTLQNMIELYQRQKLAGSFKPTAFREEAALLSEGENMYAFQICNIPSADEKIIHYEFLGCIAEDMEGEEEQEDERESNKRSIDEVMESADDNMGQGSTKKIR